MPRINYAKNHYCKTCEKKFPVDIFRCDECGMQISTKPRKQKHERYIPVPRNEFYKHIENDIKETFMKVKVQCKSTHPMEEHRY